MERFPLNDLQSVSQCSGRVMTRPYNGIPYLPHKLQFISPADDSRGDILPLSGKIVNHTTVKCTRTGSVWAVDTVSTASPVSPVVLM